LFFLQAEDGIRDDLVTGVQTCALPISITLEPEVRIEPRDVSGEDKVAATMEVCRAQKRDEVANTNASYSDSDWTFELANTWGTRSEERRVGKEGRNRCVADH